MSPRTLALLAAGVAGIACYFWWSRGGPSGDAATSRAVAGQSPESPSDAGAARSEPPSALVSTGDSDASQSTRTGPEESELAGVIGVAGRLLPDRPVREDEKAAVRELIKLFGAAQAPEAVGDESERPPGTEPDSLFLKYGSYDVRRLQEEHASLRAILAWQDNGPFDDKAAEMLPAILRRTMEYELDYLEQKILYP